MHSIETATVWLKALADPSRLRMVHVLQLGTFRVGEMVRILELPQSLVSHHLRSLAGAGLVQARKQGSLVYYSLASSAAAGPSENLLSELLLLLKRSETARGDRERAAQVLEERTAHSRTFFDRLGDRWDGLRDDFVDLESYLAAIGRAVPVCGCLVDVGCGTGSLLRQLASRARKLVGVDHSPEMIRIARGNLERWSIRDADLRLGELAHLPLSDGEADVVVAAMVLHHINEPARIMPELARVLSEDGLLVIADFLAHGDERLRRQAADLWLGFEPEEVAAWLGGEFHDVKIEVVRGRPDRHPLLIASAVKGAEAA